jgi:hypothetical protein
MSLGALGYFYNKYNATQQIIKNYRDFYPTNTLVFINDAGLSELSDIASAYNAIYLPYDENLTTGNNCDDIEVMIKWFERFFTAVNYITEDYFIILEDDVCILKNINLNLQYDMNGYNPTALLPEKVTTYLKQFNPYIKQNKIFYSGCGGCILKTEFFKSMSQLDWKNELYIYAELTKRNSKTEQSWYFNDTCISFLCWRYGGRIGENPEWNELQTPYTYEFDAHVRNNKTSVLHRYRKFF